MERALEALRIPHAFLVFPGEARPWARPGTGYIKVREELKWLQKYDQKYRDSWQRTVHISSPAESFERV